MQQRRVGVAEHHHRFGRRHLDRGQIVAPEVPFHQLEHRIVCPRPGLPAHGTDGPAVGIAAGAPRRLLRCGVGGQRRQPVLGLVHADAAQLQRVHRLGVEGLRRGRHHRDDVLARRMRVRARAPRRRLLIAGHEQLIEPLIRQIAAGEGVGGPIGVRQPPQHRVGRVGVAVRKFDHHGKRRRLAALDLADDLPVDHPETEHVAVAVVRQAPLQPPVVGCVGHGLPEASGHRGARRPGCVPNRTTARRALPRRRSPGGPPSPAPGATVTEIRVDDVVAPRHITAGHPGPPSSRARRGRPARPRAIGRRQASTDDAAHRGRARSATPRPSA